MNPRNEKIYWDAWQGRVSQGRRISQDRRVSQIRRGIIRQSSIMRWSFLRHRFLFTSYTILQAMFALAIIFGLTLMLDMKGNSAVASVNSGVWQLCLITIGCNLAPQTMAGSISEGFMDYQRNLPVSRVGILLSDWIIWVVVVAPGTAVAILAGWARFDLAPHNIGLLALALIASMFSCLAFGYMVALWFSQDVVTILGQAIMFLAMLFSPILYPASRLPHQIIVFHNCLPFVPMHRIIMALAFPWTGSVCWTDAAVVLAWFVACFAICLGGLYKRK